MVYLCEERVLIAPSAEIRRKHEQRIFPFEVRFECHCQIISLLFVQSADVYWYYFHLRPDSPFYERQIDFYEIFFLFIVDIRGQELKALRSDKFLDSLCTDTERANRCGEPCRGGDSSSDERGDRGRTDEVYAFEAAVSRVYVGLSGSCLKA